MRAFASYASTTCPACGAPKARLHWVCVACREHGSTDNRTPAFTALESACAAHVEAAENYIAAVKLKRGIA
jgi:lipopolysaccharide biosynthesis regulator YciM